MSTVVRDCTDADVPLLPDALHARFGSQLFRDCFAVHRGGRGACLLAERDGVP